MLTYEFIRLFVHLHPLLLKYRSESFSSKQVLLSKDNTSLFCCVLPLVMISLTLISLQFNWVQLQLSKQTKNVALGESWSVQEPIISKLFAHKYIFMQILKYNIYVTHSPCIFKCFFFIYFLFKFYLLFSFH